ncbi:apoptosis-associated speck-like protein containing a CARD [Bombina bombina]|uniref:apoptosis-associated speck-like protein containing a CARD n=1 Tax=Bombina bombina TaxID=8345 RepID=UPI00235B1224|nr:apoptosis-associated speck-like protein containing a CARD [Bombina bombina]XP_053550287.1 apoptosis-associated speck-like protein containing a CARD [Bombina bombina]XP_053550288.1 apoptosis-associated speck-like protein containing a CARD [Bombina bombina]
MGKSLRDVILGCLENMTEKDFKKFKAKLNDYEVAAKYRKIPKGPLEKADDIDVTDLLLKYYTDEYAPVVVAEVLDAIDAKQTKCELQNALKKAGYGPFYQGQAAASDEGHFIDKHREALIQRMSQVDPVLDTLLQEQLLTSEKYDNVRSKTTSQQQMRQLYCYIREWGRPDKEKLYQAIKKCNPPLIKDLERS